MSDSQLYRLLKFRASVICWIPMLLCLGSVSAYAAQKAKIAVITIPKKNAGSSVSLFSGGLRKRLGNDFRFVSETNVLEAYQGLGDKDEVARASKVLVAWSLNGLVIIEPSVRTVRRGRRGAKRITTINLMVFGGSPAKSLLQDKFRLMAGSLEDSTLSSKAQAIKALIIRSRENQNRSESKWGVSAPAILKKQESDVVEIARSKESANKMAREVSEVIWDSATQNNNEKSQAGRVSEADPLEGRVGSQGISDSRSVRSQRRGEESNRQLVGFWTPKSAKTEVSEPVEKKENESATTGTQSLYRKKEVEGATKGFYLGLSLSSLGRKTDLSGEVKGISRGLLSLNRDGGLATFSPGLALTLDLLPSAFFSGQERRLEPLRLHFGLEAHWQMTCVVSSNSACGDTGTTGVLSHSFSVLYEFEVLRNRSLLLTPWLGYFGSHYPLPENIFPDTNYVGGSVGLSIGSELTEMISIDSYLEFLFPVVISGRLKTITNTVASSGNGLGIGFSLGIKMPEVLGVPGTFNVGLEHRSIKLATESDIVVGETSVKEATILERHLRVHMGLIREF
ncbi:MAG: hypothetical protein VYA34_05230 [Myxococcota bacterium]|nr:hypothetical protein [Myxococcota bacterium]